MLSFARHFRGFPLRSLSVAALGGFVVISTAGCAKEEKPEYGSVRISFRAGNGVDADKIFEPTKEIRVIAPYNSCVTKYYRGEGASQLFVTPEGEKVMEEWAERICAKSDPSDRGRAAKHFVECDPDNVKFTQKVDDDVDNPHLEIRVILETRSDARDLAVNDLRIGPLPTEALTGCKSAFLFESRGIEGRRNNRPVWKAISEVAGSQSPTPDSVSAYIVTVAPPGGF